MNDPQEFPCYSALAGAVFYHPDRFSSTAFHVATVVPIGRSVRQWTVREDEARASEAQRFGLQFARFHIDSLGADRATIDHEAMVAILNGALREHVAQGRMQEA